MREQLLQSAASLVLERGAASLTFGALCEAAQISRGGVLHYFRSKSSLLKALVDYLVTRLEADVDQRACVPQARRALTLLCSAHPELIERARSRSGRCSRVRRARDSGSLEELHLQLVADGLWLADLFGWYNITPERRLALLAMLKSVKRDRHGTRHR